MDGNYYFVCESKGLRLCIPTSATSTHERKAVAGVMNIILKEDAQALDEVVVVGYGVQKKSSVTGAISQVKSEDIQESFYNPCRRSLTRQDGRGTAGVYYFSAGFIT